MHANVAASHRKSVRDIATCQAVKLHTLLDLLGNIPVFVDITDGKVHDVNTFYLIVFEPDAIYVMDKGYTDFFPILFSPPNTGLIHKPVVLLI